MKKRAWLSLGTVLGSGCGIVILSSSVVPIPSTASLTEVLGMVVANTVVAAGILLLGWSALTALLAGWATSMTILGQQSHRLQVFIQRFGLPLLRRVLTLTLAGTAITAPAYASEAPHSTEESPHQGQQNQHRTHLDDIGWGHGIEAEPQPNHKEPTHHTVIPGDSLWTITHQHLGPLASPTTIAGAWPKIYALNKEKIGDNPHIIHPGITLKLPNREEM